MTAAANIDARAAHDRPQATPGRRLSRWVRYRRLAAAMGLGVLLVGILLVWPFTAGSDSGSFLEIGLCLFLGLSAFFMFSPGYGRSSVNSRSILYLVPLWLYFLVSIVACVFAGDAKNLAWLAFGLALFILILARDPTRLPIVEGYRIVSFTAVAVYFAFNYQEILSFGVGRGRVSFGNPAYTLSAYALATAVVASIYAHIHRIGRWYVNGAFFAISLLCVISTGTRSVYIGLALASAAIAFGTIGLSRRRLRRFVWIAPVAAAGVIAAVSIPAISERLEVLSENMLTGFLAFTGGGGEERSAQGRFNTRNIAIETFLDHPLAGAGYKTLWVDFPVVQAFQDLGILFGSIFVIAFILIPARALFMSFRAKDVPGSFICLMYLMNAPRLFFHGQPYDWTSFAFAVPAYGVLLSLLARRNGGRTSG